MKTINCSVVLTASLLISMSAFGQTLRDQASHEIENSVVSGEKIKKSPMQTPAHTQVSGVLKLKDEYSSYQLRDYKWKFGFSLESYRPSGAGQLGTSGSYSLDQAGATALPSLTLGSLWKAAQADYGVLDVGFYGQAGYSSQELRLSTGNQAVLDARLNSSFALLALEAQMTLTRFYLLQLLFDAGVGQWTVTQTSTNSFAQWNEKQDYIQNSWGLGRNVTETLAVEIKNIYRQKMNARSDKMILPTGQWALGAKLLW